ncbi:MAG: TIGR01906 family membrane protein [Chloroflexota bacterium]
MRLRSTLKGIAAVLFVISLPILFGTISLRWLVSDTGWYRSNFVKYGVSARTRISPEELGRSAEEISRYLLLKRDDVDLRVRIGNDTRPLFGERELVHMLDVQKLLGSFYTLQMAAAGYSLLYLGASRLWLREGYWRSLGNKLRWGGGLTLGLFGGFGLLSMFSFDDLFLQFHLISFDNDLWMLDPTRDNLIMMFPQGFWYDSAIRLALATGAQALGALLAGSLLARQQSTISHQPSARR